MPMSIYVNMYLHMYVCLLVDVYMRTLTRVHACFLKAGSAHLLDLLTYQPTKILEPMEPRNPPAYQPSKILEPWNGSTY